MVSQRAVTPVPFPDNIAATGADSWHDVEIIAGWNHTFALAPDGSLFGWGANNLRQLGIGNTVHQRVPVLIPFPANIAATGAQNWGDMEIIPGRDHTFARAPDGSLFGWGANGTFQLGLNTNAAQNSPVLIPFPANLLSTGATSWADIEFFNEASHVFSKTNHTLALAPDGSLIGWGTNEVGQLGNGSSAHQRVPMILPFPAIIAATGATSWADVRFSSGSNTTFVLAPDGSLFGWGTNHFGELAVGNTTPRHIPVEIPFRAIFSAAGAESWTDMQLIHGTNHTFALAPDGSLFAWGHGEFGRLGNNATMNHVQTTPALIPFPAILAGPNTTSWADVEIMAGWTHNFALTADDNLFAWGRNSSGELGTVVTTNRGLPEPVPLPANIVAAGIGSWAEVGLIRGGGHTFALVPAPRLALIKTLQTTEGTSLPDLSFYFRFEAVSLDGDQSLASSMPVIPYQASGTLPITDKVIDDGVASVTAQISNLLLNIPTGTFSQAGAHIYRLTLKPIVSTALINDPSAMIETLNFSGATYYVTILVGYVSATTNRLTITRASASVGVPDSNIVGTGDTVRELAFTSSFARTLIEAPPIPGPPNTGVGRNLMSTGGAIMTRVVALAVVVVAGLGIVVVRRKYNL